MKKVLSFVLVVSLVLGLCSIQVVAAIATGDFSIYSNDGTQALYMQVDNFLDALTVTETGALLEYHMYMDPDTTYTDTFTYSGSSFAGFATSANAETAVYTVGNRYTNFGDSVSLYIVESNTSDEISQKLSGVWKFKDDLTYDSTLDGMTQEISFTSAGVSYSSIVFGNFKGDQILNYDDSQVCVLNSNYGTAPGWADSKDQTVDFGATPQAVSNEFYTWFTANAVQQEQALAYIITGDAVPDATSYELYEKTEGYIDSGTLSIGKNVSGCRVKITFPAIVSSYSNEKFFAISDTDYIRVSHYSYSGSGIFSGISGLTSTEKTVTYNIPEGNYVVSIMKSGMMLDGGGYGGVSGTYSKTISDSYTLKATSSTLYFDLTTLGLSAGSHVFVVKAKADGYLDSDYSNEVIYTVQQEYSVDGTVTNGSLRGLGEDEPATSVMAGESLTIRVVNNIDYTLPETVTVTMGGEVLTSGYTYDNETGVIVIEAVTGDIVITANCLEVAKGYTLTFDGTAYYKSSLWSGSDNLFKLNFADGTERILTLGNVETALSNKQSFSNVVSIYLYGQQDDGLSSIYTGTISPDMTGLVHEDIYVLESDVTFTYVFPD